MVPQNFNPHPPTHTDFLVCTPPEKFSCILFFKGFWFCHLCPPWNFYWYTEGEVIFWNCTISGSHGLKSLLLQKHSWWESCWYYPSQTSVNKGFFSAHFTDRWFHSAVQKFWSRENIFCCSAVSKILITWCQTVCFTCIQFHLQIFYKPQSCKNVMTRICLTTDWNQLREVGWKKALQKHLSEMDSNYCHICRGTFSPFFLLADYHQF